MAAARRARVLPAGDVVFAQGAEPVRHLRVMHTGTIELAAGGRVLDVLGEGELFGHGSLLSGLPPAFSARAVEDSSCYRIAAERGPGPAVGPAGVRFVARSLLEEPTELHMLAREPARQHRRRAGRQPGPR